MSEQVFTSCTSQGPIFVHVKDGRITRIRPMVFDETDVPSWTIEVNGKTCRLSKFGVVMVGDIWYPV